jgi:hypothetical protein
MISRLARAVNKAMRKSDNADAPDAERRAAGMLDQGRQNNPAAAADALSRNVEAGNHKPGSGFHDGAIMRSNPDAHVYELDNRSRRRLSSRSIRQAT